MGQGDLVKSLFPDEHSESTPTVRRRARKPLTGSGSTGLRPLPRARGELDLVELRDPEVGFSDLAIDDERRQLFAEVHLELQKADRLYAHGVSPRRTFLFYGPPGCGKSATAEAVADELGRQLAVVNLATVVSSYLGDTAKNLSAIFDVAKAEPWVILFDEFDAIGKERSDRTDHGELKRVVTAFLQKLERFGGPSILIAATNHASLLDLAIWRRFDEVLEFPRPTNHQLRSALRVRLRPIPRERGIDIEALARACKGFSYADVDRAILTAYRSHLLSDDPDSPLSEAAITAGVEHQSSRLDLDLNVG